MSSDKRKRDISADRRSAGMLGRRKTIYGRRNLSSEVETGVAAALPVVKLTGESVNKLLHELHVHQIELETQNEELRRAYLALEESRDAYLDLFDFAPVGYMTLTEKGLIATVNFAAATLLGVERKKLLSHHLSRYVEPEYTDQLYFFLSPSSQHEKKSTEVKIKRADAKPCYVRIDLMRVESKSGVITLRAALSDITRRKLAEQELRIAATAFDVQEGIMVTDDRRIIMRVNKAFTQITGYAEHEVIGVPATILRSGKHDAAFFRRIWDTVGSVGCWQGEIWDKRKDGEIFPAFMGITAVRGEDGVVSHYVGSMLDLTLRKQAEKILLDDRKLLEKKVEKSVVELNRMKEEGDEISTALKVMAKLRESESAEARNILILEFKQEVMPFLQRLKHSSRDARQIRLLNALDANLQRLISSYGGATNISSIYQNLTPKEIQVASMVREGASTKVIASTLSLSPETVSIHRKNIRKKLNLDSRANNLRSYLITLEK